MQQPQTDEDLVAVLRGGDMAAFDQLYARYATRLHGYVRRMVTEQSRAEDIFQDVFFRVVRDRTFDPQRGRFSAWLFTVARNACLADVRKRERRAQLEVHKPEPAARDLESDVAEASRVRHAMAGLTETQRQILLLKQLGELSYREIGAILGVAEGTIKSRLHTATKAFRARLVEIGEGT